MGKWAHGSRPDGGAVIDDEELRPGDNLGRYELLVPVAQGGMATVWAARIKGPRGFSKMLAVKAMLPALGEDEQFEQMFLAEGKLAARISHPNVCDILDIGEQNGLLYIAMEWIDGEPLAVVQRAAARRDGMPPGIAARIGAGAALGLHAAHEVKGDDGQLVGLVHRDVSPQNLLVTYDGKVKIVDFGVAKAAAYSADLPKTRVGETKGTLTFMSPEQAASGSIDRRSDIFSLGVVLYQLIGGTHPFKAENEYVTLGRILSPAPVTPLVSVNPSCPPALNAIVMKALEKRPENRYATMAEMAQALQRAADELGGPADIGAFVRDLLGDRGQRRTDAIRDAMRLIDERDAGGAKGQRVRLPAPALRLTLPSVDMTTLGPPPPPAPPVPDASTTAPDTSTTAVSTTPPPSRSTLKIALLVAGGLLLVLAAGVLGAVRARNSTAEDAQGGPAASSATATATATGGPPPPR